MSSSLCRVAVAIGVAVFVINQQGTSWLPNLSSDAWQVVRKQSLLLALLFHYYFSQSGDLR